VDAEGYSVEKKKPDHLATTASDSRGGAQDDAIRAAWEGRSRRQGESLETNVLGLRKERSSTSDSFLVRVLTIENGTTHQSRIGEAPMARRPTAIVLRKLAEESARQLKAMVTELEGNRVAIEGKPTGWAKRFKASGKSRAPRIRASQES